MSTSHPSVSVVVPVYNEEACLNEFIQRTTHVLTSLPNPTELLLVDDGSRDGSPGIIARAAEEFPGMVSGILLNRNYGQHPAVLAGMADARGDIVVTLDADLQNPPEEIPQLLAKAQEGYDVVGSVRRKRQDALFRRFFSRLVNKLTAKVTGIQMQDYGCMLRAYKRSVVEAMLQCTEHSTFIPVLANSFANRTAEIQVAHSDRPAGESKYNLLKLINLQFDLLTSMTTLPLRMLSFVGLVLSMSGIGFGIFLMIMRIIFGSEWAVKGVFTLFAVLFFFVGAQFLAMGLLGEYIGRIYKDVRGRPRYLVQKRVGTSRLTER